MFPHGTDGEIEAGTLTLHGHLSGQPPTVVTSQTSCPHAEMHGVRPTLRPAVTRPQEPPPEEGKTQLQAGPWLHRHGFPGLATALLGVRRLLHAGQCFPRGEAPTLALLWRVPNAPPGAAAVRLGHGLRGHRPGLALALMEVARSHRPPAGRFWESTGSPTFPSVRGLAGPSRGG